MIAGTCTVRRGIHRYRNRKYKHQLPEIHKFDFTLEFGVAHLVRSTVHRISGKKRRVRGEEQIGTKHKMKEAESSAASSCEEKISTWDAVRRGKGDEEVKKCTST